MKPIRLISLQFSQFFLPLVIFRSLQSVFFVFVFVNRDTLLLLMSFWFFFMCKHPYWFMLMFFFLLMRVKNVFFGLLSDACELKEAHAMTLPRFFWRKKTQWFYFTRIRLKNKRKILLVNQPLILVGRTRSKNNVFVFKLNTQTFFYDACVFFFFLSAAFQTFLSLFLTYPSILRINFLFFMRRCCY